MLRPLPTQSAQRVPKKCVWGRSPRRAALALALCVISPALATAQSYSLAWNQNPDPVTVGYVVFGGLQPGNYVWSADVGRATTASLPPLPPGNSYYFVVRAYNATGQLGPASAEISLDLGSPGAPTGVSATSTGARVTLSWESPVQGGAVSQYLVSVGRAPGASDLVASYPVGAARSVSGDLGPGRYFARVRAVNSHSAGPESAEISFTVGGPSQPGPASGLAASWAGSTLTLTWNPAYGAAGYVIEVGSGPGLSNLALINVGNTTSVAGAVPPGTYYVRVRAVNGGGHGAPSNEIVVRR